MSIFDKQAWVVWLIKLARKWTIYGFADDHLGAALKAQISWMKYTENEESEIF